MIKSYIPRVAAVNDLSGFGRVSLTEAMPIMSAMGLEVCPLPTAVLSTHTYKFEKYTFLDMTTEMEKILAHWTQLGIKFDAVCTGYMGSARQIELVSDFIRGIKANGGLAVIDPVLGDNILSDAETVYYDRMNDLLCSMKKFASLADVITPNLTEACLLLDEEYPKGNITHDKLRHYLKELSRLGPKYVAITSVMTDDDHMCVGVYDRDADVCHEIDCGYVNRPFHGTGDIFAAVLTGALVKGIDFCRAAEISVDFIKKAIAETLKYPDIKIEHGVVFEPVLTELSALCRATESQTADE